MNIEFNKDEISFLSDLVRNEMEIAYMDADEDYIKQLTWLAVKLEVQK
tara:strand:+ start:731 stop:874 length:144 start_codon:yes stop_codon:yes gene_type:complete